MTILTFDTVADLASGIPLGSLVFVLGYHSPTDGGQSIWRKSSVQGVRGKPIHHSGGANLPPEEYLVKLVGGGGEGATARVVVRTSVVATYTPPWSQGPQDDFANCTIVEPGWGYTSNPSLSTNPSDWTIFHSNGIPAVFTGSETFPDIEFNLADNILSVRTAINEEFLLNHNGVFEARQLGIRCTADSLTDDKYFQEAICAILRGRTQIVHQYGGGPEAGGNLKFPTGLVPLNGSTIYANPTGHPAGPECVALNIEGAARPSPRPTRPDGTPGGTQLQYGLIVVGDQSTTGDFKSVTRGFRLTNLGISGGIELHGVQHAFELSNLLINPDKPVGQIIDGYRVKGYGLWGTKCSTGLIERVVITGGKQTYFDSYVELGGAKLVDCDQVEVKACIFSFCRTGVHIGYNVGGQRNTSLKFHGITSESNIFEDVIAEACRNLKLSVTSLGANNQDSTTSRIRIGAPGVDSTCYVVDILNGSLSGEPVMIEHPVIAVLEPDRIQVRDDYTGRYQVGQMVALVASNGFHKYKQIVSSSYNSGNHRTTINVGSGVISTITDIIRAGNQTAYASVQNIGSNRIAISGNLESTFKPNTWTIIHHPSGGRPAKVESSSYASGTGLTTIKFIDAAVDSQCTAVRICKPASAPAIDVVRARGVFIQKNSILNYSNAVRYSTANVSDVNYVRGDWNGAAGDEQIWGP